MKISKETVLLAVLASMLLAFPLSAASVEDDPIEWSKTFRVVYQETPEGRAERAKELAATQYLPYFTEIGFGVGGTEQFFGVIGRSGPALQGLNNSFGDLGLLIGTYQMIVDIHTGAVKWEPRTLLWAKDATLWAMGRFGSRLVGFTALGLTMIDYSITSAVSGILNEYETHWYEVYDWYFWQGPGKRSSDDWADCFEDSDTLFPKYRAAMDAFWTTPGNGFERPEALFDHYYKDIRKMAKAPINYQHSTLANATMRDRFRARFFKTRIGPRVKVVLEERYEDNLARLEIEIRRRHRAIQSQLRSLSLLTVHVTDKDTGEAVSGALVAVKYPGGSDARKTGATGEVKILIKRDVEAEVSVSAQDYKTQSVKETGKKGGSSITISLEKKPEETVLGVLVQNKKAEAISGAQVKAAWGESARAGTTGADGHCTLTLGAEGKVTVTATAKGYKAASADLTAPVAAKNITLTLDRDEDEPRDILTVSVTAIDGETREWFQRGSRFVGKVGEADLPEGEIGQVEWIIIAPNGKRVPSKIARSGRAGLTITIKSTDKWPLGEYELVAIVHVKDEGALSGRGSFVLKDEYLPVDIKQPCRTGQWSAVGKIEGLPFTVGNDLQNVSIEGLGKFSDKKFWKLEGKRISFRPVEPGYQQPTFALVYKQDRAKCMGRVKVELTEMPIEIDWEKTKKVGNKNRVDFTMFLPDSFEPRFDIRINPNAGVFLNKSPRKAKNVYRFDGHVIVEDLPSDQRIVFDLTDKTKAVAQGTLVSPDTCVCMRPPRNIRQYVKQFENPQALIDKAMALQDDDAAAEAFGRKMAQDSIAFYEWIGGLKKCKHLSPRARAAFTNMARLARKAMREEDVSEEEGMALARQFRALNKNDIKPGFMKGVMAIPMIPQQ